RNLIAKIVSVLILIYIFLVFGFFFTHLDESFLALMVLTVFIVTTLLWMFINQRIQKGVDIDTAKYELEPLGKELIQEFVPSRGRTDDFFIDLERMLVPVAGLKFETQNWQVSALIARKYNVQVTILHIGKDESKLDKPKAVFDKYNVKYDVILRQRNSRTVASEIINTYHEGSYQLINLASRRKKRWLDRLLDTSVSKKVVDSVDATILQVHPPKYGQSREDIANMFLLLDGTERDTFLGRWANIVSSAGVKSKIFAYHVVQIPQTISLEDAAEFPEVKQSAREFEAYSRGITDGLGLNATPTLLYGHNFVKSLVLATQMHEPDAVLIGHTKDVGLWNRIRTRLAYRIMNKVDSAVIVHHMGENQNGNETS
ncbi:MAG: hypothetical protein ACXAB7_09160, partial [Candidatus Kariarchaeaceae archaeon]